RLVRAAAPATRRSTARARDGRSPARLVPAGANCARSTRNRRRFHCDTVPRPISSSSAWRSWRARENVQRRVLQQHDSLAIDDLAPSDHAQRLGNRQFDALDVLALVTDSAAGARLGRRIVLGDEEVESLRHRARAHERIEDLAYGADAIAGFLLRLGAN